MEEIEIKKEIKDCPLCGGKPQMKWKGKNGRILRCIKCHFGITQKVIRFTTDWLENKLIEDWNRRM